MAGIDGQLLLITITNGALNFLRVAGWSWLLALLFSCVCIFVCVWPGLGGDPLLSHAWPLQLLYIFVIIHISSSYQHGLSTSRQTGALAALDW